MVIVFSISFVSFVVVVLNLVVTVVSTAVVVVYGISVVVVVIVFCCCCCCIGIIEIKKKLNRHVVRCQQMISIVQ